MCAGSLKYCTDLPRYWDDVPWYRCKVASGDVAWLRVRDLVFVECSDWKERSRGGAWTEDRQCVLAFTVSILRECNGAVCRLASLY